MFVDSLLTVQPLEDAVVDQLKSMLSDDMAHDPTKLVQSASEVLSGMTEMAGWLLYRKNSSKLSGKLNFLNCLVKSLGDLGTKSC